MHGALRAHLESRQVARVLYGSIIGLALLLALQSHHAGDGETIGWLVATALAVSLAELYSEVVGTATRTHRRVAGATLGSIASESAATAAGIAFPCTFFVAAALGILDTDAAFTAAKWSGLGLITAYGFTAARMTGAGLLEAVGFAAVAAVLAGLLIVVKALLH